MTLYWHRWRTSRGVVYLLFDFPQNHDDFVRSLGELAIVHRLSAGWRASINQRGCAPSHWLIVKSPAQARRLVEEWIDRKSIAMFEDDNVEFVQAA